MNGSLKKELCFAEVRIMITCEVDEEVMFDVYVDEQM